MSGFKSHLIYEVGDFRLDATRRLLFAKGASDPLPITPKVFETILYFVERPGELLEKDRLLAELWPGLVVEENNLTQVISVVRRVLGETPGENRYLKTLATCRTANGTSHHNTFFATTISGNSLIELTQKRGERSLGARIRNRTRASGLHEGGIAEATMTPLARSGYRAANNAAMRPPYEMPQMIAEDRRVASRTSLMWRR